MVGFAFNSGLYIRIFKKAVRKHKFHCGKAKCTGLWDVPLKGHYSDVVTQLMENAHFHQTVPIRIYKSVQNLFRDFVIQAFIKKQENCDLVNGVLRSI